MRRNEVPIKSLPHSRHRNFKLKAAFGAERGKAAASIPLASEIARERRRRASLVLDGFHRRSWRSCAPRDTQPSQVRNERESPIRLAGYRRRARDASRLLPQSTAGRLLALGLGRGGGPIGRTPKSRGSGNGTYCEHRTDRVHCAADAPKITGPSLVNRLSIPRIPAIRSANVRHRPAYRRRFLHG